MIVPLPETADFCNFVLTTPFIKLTPARKLVVTEIRDASLAKTSVTINQWNNFLLSTFSFYTTWQLNQEFYNNVPEPSTIIYYSS